MNRLFLALLLSLWAIPTFAIAPIESDGSASISSGANTIYLDNGTGTKGTYSHVIVWTLASSDTINITFNQGATASASNASLPAGASLAYGLVTNSPSTNQVNYYDASGGTGTICWMAW